jgi:hypothetical protein
VSRNPELVAAEANVERARARVADAVVALRDEVARRTDWRSWIGRRPGTFLVTAFALGFLLGHRRGAGASHPQTRRMWPWR